MSDKDPTISIAAAAVFMKISRRHARRLLTERHERNPEMGLLTRPSGSAEGKIEVNVRVLLMLRRGNITEELEALESRVGMTEADIQGLTIRLEALQRAVSHREKSQSMGFL
jgi:rubrerythrin